MFNMHHYMQSNEVNGSYHMEKEGLQLVRAVEFLRKKKFKIATLVTDRHYIANIKMGKGKTYQELTTAMIFGTWQNVSFLFFR